MTTKSEASRPPEARCSCGHLLSEHMLVEHTDAHGRTVRTPGKCWAVTGAHVEHERELVCRKRPHAHDGPCRVYCAEEEHLHTDSCYEDRARPAYEHCDCHAFDARTERQRALDAYQESRRCASCGHDEKYHLTEGPRPCRKSLGSRYPFGWTCHECNGYVPVSEFALNPHGYLGSRPSGWSPTLELRAKELRDERAKRESEFEKLASERGEDK